MNKEQLLYDKFVDKLTELLDNPDVTDKELRIILNFLTDNNIGANPEQNEGLKKIADRLGEELPFAVDEFPIERI